jgi:hypothetical protein
MNTKHEEAAEATDDMLSRRELLVVEHGVPGVSGPVDRPLEAHGPQVR